MAKEVDLDMQKAIFGKSPSGKRLERIRKSPNYRNGQFQNINPTPSLTEGSSYFQVLFQFLFNKTSSLYPTESLPSVKTNLLELPKDENILVWFGHSSYYLQIDGKRLLVDPVLSGSASPIPGTNRAFEGTDLYTAEEIPAIDYLFITHDHYDHTDYHTLVKLRPKIQRVICGLGVGEHLEYWGYAPESIIEKDWNETFDLENGLSVHTTTGRHFSGRGLKRNNTLWMSYVLRTPAISIFIGGDSGYDRHFAEIGEKYGPFDLAILENGQYDAKWKYIHLIDDEVIRAGNDLRARRILPVHSSKFALANHAWFEPLANLTQLNSTSNIPLITPMIGEPVYLSQTDQVFSQWWIGRK